VTRLIYEVESAKSAIIRETTICDDKYSVVGNGNSVGCTSDVVGSSNDDGGAYVYAYVCVPITLTSKEFLSAV